MKVTRSVKLVKMIHSLDENTPTKIDSKKIVVRQKYVYRSSLNCQRKEEFLDLTPDSEENYLVSGHLGELVP